MRLISGLFFMALLMLLVVGCASEEEKPLEKAEEEAGVEELEQASEQTSAEEATLVEEITNVSKVSADRQFAGKVAGTDAFVGIAVREDTDEFIAYVCDGPAEGPVEGVTHTWFMGPLPENGLVDFTQDGDRLQALLAPEGVSGTVTFNDENATIEPSTYSFEAEPVAADGDAGLYWGKSSEETGLAFRPGLVVLPNGEERGTSYPPFIRCRSILAMFGFAGVCIPP